MICKKGEDITRLEAQTETTDTAEETRPEPHITKIAVSDLIGETTTDPGGGAPSAPDTEGEAKSPGSEELIDPEIVEIITQKQGENTYKVQETVQVPPPDTTIQGTTGNRAENEDASTERNDRVKFKLTAYCPCKECSGKWGSMTSTGVTAREGITIAVDPNVIPYGSTVEIEGYGTYIAEDCGVKGNQIDIYFCNHQDTVNFGVRYAYVKW